jgi:hypothetical protein
LKTRNGNIRSNGQQCTPKAEEGYCNEATQSAPLTQSKPPSPKYNGTYRGKTKKGLDKKGNKRSDMVLYVLQATLYRKLQDIV